MGLTLAACGGDGTEDSTGTTAAGGAGTTPQLSGSIFVSGSSTVEPITALAAEKFARSNPGVSIKVDGPGTGDGFQLFCRGETDISDASRAISSTEVEACRAAGIEFIELKVAIDGLSVITSTRNSAVTCLSFPDLYALLGPESRGFSRWNAANSLGSAVSGSGSYPDAPLVVTAPGEESGTYDSFVEIVLQSIARTRNQTPAARIDYQSSPNDNVIIDGISGNDTSLGWVGYSFAEENRNRVKLLEIKKTQDAACVAPTPATIANNTYPISRPLFIYVNKSKLASNAALGPFVDFYLSDAGMASVEEGGYVELDSAALASTRSTWTNKTVGKAAA